MSQHYSDPRRADDPYSLPDVETFQMAYRYCPECESLMQDEDAAGMVVCSDDACPVERLRPTFVDWFYWYCLPGCLPDSDPIGPFASEDEALADARENAGGQDRESYTDTQDRQNYIDTLDDED